MQTGRTKISVCILLMALTRFAAAPTGVLQSAGSAILWLATVTRHAGELKTTHASTKADAAPCCWMS